MTTDLIRHGDVRLPPRFWSKVSVSDSGCWTWRAFVSDDGYGRFGTDGHMRRAHRFAYERLVGSVRDGIDLDHLCRNRACVNPNHLEPVTRQENLLRGAQGYQIRNFVCINGHDVLAAGMRMRPRGERSISRACRECAREQARERNRIIMAAAHALGLTQSEYRRRHGSSIRIAQILGGTEPLDTAERHLTTVGS